MVLCKYLCFGLNAFTHWIPLGPAWILDFCPSKESHCRSAGYNCNKNSSMGRKISYPFFQQGMESTPSLVRWSCSTVLLASIWATLHSPDLTRRLPPSPSHHGEEARGEVEVSEFMIKPPTSTHMWNISLVNLFWLEKCACLVSTNCFACWIWFGWNLFIDYCQMESSTEILAFDV